MRMTIFTALATCLGSLAACSQPSVLEPTAPQVLASISDGAHGGQEHFYFLPPLVTQPEFGGTFDPSRVPVVQVCALQASGCEAVVAEYSLSTGPGSETVRIDTTAEHYVVNFHTDEFALEDGQIYRIRVLLDGREAGHADILPVANGQELKNAETNQEIPLVNGRTLPIKFRIEEGLEVAEPVPDLPPDSIPSGALADSIYAPDNQISDPRLGDWVPKDIVFISFDPGASQELRQEAVDLIGGRVIGGVRVHPGAWYIVRIPTDGTAEPLVDAIQALEALPQVRAAISHPPAVIPTYRRPSDGPGWQPADWALNPDDASGLNWSPEAIAAPLAWGCATGDPSTRIDVVDEVDQDEHGLLVSAVLAEPGDTGTRTTGIMWEADLRLQDYFDASLTPKQLGLRMLQTLARVVQEADVVNLSLSAAYRDTATGALRPPVVGRLSDMRTARKFATEVYEALVFASTSAGDRPLIVVAAGNYAVDAFYSGLPILADSAQLSDRFLVVAASDRTRALWVNSNPSNSLNPGSNVGSLVSLAAPGAEIEVYTSNGTAIQVGGTSFAAPHVTGVAGLLRSFDPALTSSDVKALILAGAMRGGRSVAGIPLLNAYESLAASAERSGAPLCSKPVWATDGTLFTRRTPGSAPEVLASVGSPVGQVEVLHGGKYIRYLTPGATHFLAWDSSSRTWEPTNQPSNFAELRAGTHASLLGQSHSRDSVAVVDVSNFANTRWYETQTSRDVPVLVGEFTGSPATAGQITVNDLPGVLQNTCLERDSVDQTCFLSVRETREWLFRLAYPQFPTDGATVERLAHITVSPLQVVREDSTGWAPCSFDATHECRVMTFRQRHAESVVYRMNLTGGGNAPDLVQTVADTSIFWIAHDEHGEDLVLESGRWSITLQADAGHFYQTGSPYFGQVASVETCEIEYRKQVDFGLVGAPISEPDGCNFGQLNFPSQGGGAGTVAPSVLAPELVASRSIEGLGITDTSSSMNSSMAATSVPLPVYGHDPAQGLVELGP